MLHGESRHQVGNNEGGEQCHRAGNNYTCGSCNKNGDARAGGGIWYGNNKPLNRAIRVSKDLPQMNNTGEMLAIYHTAKNAPSDTTLCIKMGKPNPHN